MKDIGSEFVEKTKYKNMGRSDQQKGLPQPPLEAPVNDKVELIDLPSPKLLDLDSVDIRKLIEKRRSIRSFSSEPLTLKELSYLLWCTQGVKRILPRNATLRTVPSAGARHAFETYLLINRVDALEAGLYRFLAMEHKLAKIKVNSEITKKITGACLNQRFVSDSAITFIWTAVAYRMTWRYQERGYRYLYLDAGHVCQNLYLASEAIDCGTCAIGAFDDDKLNKILGLDGKEKFVLYIAAMGRKP